VGYVLSTDALEQLFAGEIAYPARWKSEVA
jgi:hypothetical protein